MFLHHISQCWSLTEHRATKAEGDGMGSNRPHPIVTSACVESLAPNVRLLIQQARLMRCWTIEDLADRIGVEPMRIQKYESGMEFPMADVLGRLQDVLQVMLVPIA